MTAAAPTETKPAAKDSGKAASTYVVLRERQGETKDTFEFIGNYSGTAEQAIRQAAASGAAPTFKDGRYVAIPARSFKPVQLSTRTETKVTIEAAK